MNYPYANGTIKAIENNILDKKQLSKLLKLPKTEILKTIIDLGYGVKSETIEDLIESELYKTKTLLCKITPNNKLINLFYMINDALNIKAFYKMKIFGINHLQIFVPTGTISKEILEKVIFNNDVNDIDNNLKNLFDSINKSIENENNPRLISTKIDKKIYEYILKHTNNNIILHYFQTTIDFTNVLTLIRSRILKWDEKQFNEIFIEGGLINIDVFLNAYNLTKDALTKAFGPYYDGKIVKGLKVYFEQLNLTSLESFFTSLTLEMMKEFQYDSFGIGPIVYYFLKKQAEAQNIRLIYANNNIDISELLEY